MPIPQEPGMYQVLRCWPCAVLAVLLLLRPAAAFTPESPEVKALVKRGLDFLERGGPALAGGMGGVAASTGEKVGEKVLVGLAFFKAGKSEHRLVKETVKSLQDQRNWRGVDNYSLGLAIIFLAELEDQQKQQNLPLIQTMVDEMVSRQKPHGGFGYDLRFGGADSASGDISQTQYAVLAFWNARMAKAKVPQETIERVCDFLIRVQDPSGGWPYNGIDPGAGIYERRNQGNLTHSLTAAGLGSVCVCADLLGVNRRQSDDSGDEEDTGLPEALKVVKKPKAQPVQAVGNSKIDPQLIDRAIVDGHNWLQQNYKFDIPIWKFYYMYGLERAESYRARYYYSKPPKESKWYNDGVAYLGQLIGNGPGWQGDHSPTVSTAFATLFLLRSAEKAIAKVHKDLGDGILTSGKGLPTDLSNASLKRGKVVDSPLAGEADDIVAMLEDPDNPELSRLLESNEDFQLDPDLTKRTGQIAKLRSVVSAGNWEARMVAVRGLGKARELDSVPSLLYALTDPAPRVVEEADLALRFVSRKFQGVGLPANPDRKAIQDARAAWRTWYLSIRPDAELID